MKTVLAYHGTDRMDFFRFDIAEARPYNLGLHFGTKAAAESRIAFLHEEFRRLFQKLGYDGFVYTNELEDGESAADAYCVFDDRQVAVVGEEMVKFTINHLRAA